MRPLKAAQGDADGPAPAEGGTPIEADAEAAVAALWQHTGEQDVLLREFTAEYGHGAAARDALHAASSRWAAATGRTCRSRAWSYAMHEGMT